MEDIKENLNVILKNDYSDESFLYIVNNLFPSSNINIKEIKKEYTNFSSHVENYREFGFFVTQILNSKIVKFWLYNIGKMQGNNFQIDKEPLLNIPIIYLNKDLEEKLEMIHDEIVHKKELELNSDTSNLENDIDNILFEQYGFNNSEISIINNFIVDKEK